MAMQTDLSPHSGRRTLPDRASFLLLASIIIGFLAASSAPTPLYSTYAAEWGFSAVTTTVVFGVYALAVLAALLVVGRLSDHVGRRPVLLAGLGAQALAMVVFLLADGVPELLAARIVQGLATGAVAGAVGAMLIDFDARRGPLANALSAPLGTGTGAIGAGLVVQFLPAPTRLVYVLLFVLFGVQAVGVVLMRETVSRVPGARRSLVPEFSLPPAARRAMLVATPALIAAWALPSYFASLGPSLVRTLAGSDSLLLGGVPLFVLAGAAVPVTLLLRNGEAGRVMLLGVLGMVVGTALVLGAVELGSAPAFLVASAVAGAGFGGAFQGAVRSVVPLALPHQRAGLLSLVYVVSYLALGVPAIAGGLLAVHNADVVGTAVEYGLAVLVVAVLAAVALLLQPRTPAGPVVVEQVTPAREVCLSRAEAR